MTVRPRTPCSLPKRRFYLRARSPTVAGFWRDRGWVAIGDVRPVIGKYP